MADPRADQAVVAQLRQAWDARGKLRTSLDERDKLSNERGQLDAQIDQINSSLRAIEEEQARRRAAQDADRSAGQGLDADRRDHQARHRARHAGERAVDPLPRSGQPDQDGEAAPCASRGWPFIGQTRCGWGGAPRKELPWGGEASCLPVRDGRVWPNFGQTLSARSRAASPRDRRRGRSWRAPWAEVVQREGVFEAAREVPACVHARSAPMASQVRSTLAFAGGGGDGVAPLGGGGKARLFWPFRASSPAASSENAAMPSLASAATALLGMNGARIARSEGRSVACCTADRISSRLESTSATPLDSSAGAAVELGGGAGTAAPAGAAGVRSAGDRELERAGAARGGPRGCRA